jgi:hypothetical protein
MNNEPVAYVDPIWMDRPDLVMSHQLEIGKLFARTQFKNYVPLYTAEQLHPVEEQDESFDRTASHMAGEYVAYQKELTDEEIRHIQAQCHLKNVGYDNFIMRFAKAILRKAQEK